jgi:hypothetical protein
MQEVLDILEDIRRGRTVERKQALANQAQPRTAADRLRLFVARYRGGMDITEAVGLEDSMLVDDIESLMVEAAAPTPADLPMPGVTWEPSQKLVAPTPAEPLDVEHIEVTPHCTCMAYEGVYPHRAFCWLVKTGYAVEGSRQPLAASPSPEPEAER